ncbi:hypothetical protein IFM89_001224 [Coptis chinensis]|uniref:Endonuclease/exonuclease/phosphatase domain-containing protein n=1 Tax=Coptis chinensis TaxID=261450 RepID=A0A835H0W9_9MAGN|nr:hypothetical protein IFM89_001224 [Coptis chinensis]
MESQANSESPKHREDAPQTPASCASSASVVRCTPSWPQQLINEATEVIQAIDHQAQVDQTPPRPPDKVKESNNQQLPHIWLLWKEGFSALNLIHCSNQQMTIECNGSIVTMVHASTLYVHRRSLWQELVHLNPLNIPWLIMGDFNAYLSPSEKKGGLRPTFASMEEFRDTVNMNQLIEAPSIGLYAHLN